MLVDQYAVIGGDAVAVEKFHVRRHAARENDQMGVYLAPVLEHHGFVARAVRGSLDGAHPR